jgi:hypothetical protein
MGSVVAMNGFFSVRDKPKYINYIYESRCFKYYFFLNFGKFYFAKQLQGETVVGLITLINGSVLEKAFEVTHWTKCFYKGKNWPKFKNKN